MTHPAGTPPCSTAGVTQRVSEVGTLKQYRADNSSKATNQGKKFGNANKRRGASQGGGPEPQMKIPARESTLALRRLSPGKCPLAVPEIKAAILDRDTSVVPLIGQPLMGDCPCHGGKKGPAERGQGLAFNLPKYHKGGNNDVGVCPFRGCDWGYPKGAKRQEWDSLTYEHIVQVHLPFFWCPDRACLGCARIQVGTTQKHQLIDGDESAPCGSRVINNWIDVNCDHCLPRWLQVMQRCLDLVCEQFGGPRRRVTYRDLLQDPCVTGMIERDDFFWSPVSATRERQLRLLDQHFGGTPPPSYTIPPTTIGG